jgi:periplasmic copper chaperone A
VIGRLGAVSVAALLVGLVFAAGAGAHARVSPAVSLSGELQLYSLAVPTEKSGATTTKIVLTVPKNFSIDSFVPNPGWHRVLQQTGVGDNAVVQKVTWTGGRVPSGEDSLFQFLGQPASPGTYTFEVQQTYSDGSIVDWNGSESSAAPAPSIQAVSSLDGGGGGGVSVLSIVAVVLAALALVASVFALVSRGGGGGGRPLA